MKVILKFQTSRLTHHTGLSIANIEPAMRRRAINVLKDDNNDQMGGVIYTGFPSVIKIKIQSETMDFDDTREPSIYIF
jgi:hypothetical protein